ncbi:MAG: 30S ribosomal protein S24e [Thermoplasmata archaeon]|nr:30S ribosomal protein S24e [Thermoplasmata archaeon]
MELKILEERPNPLLQRVEYKFEVAHATKATPTREEVRVELAKALKLSKDRVVIERMSAKFGTARSEGEAASYTNTEALKAIVRDHIQIRNGFKEKAVKGPAAPSEPEKPTAAPPAAAAAEPAKGA